MRESMSMGLQSISMMRRHCRRRRYSSIHAAWLSIIYERPVQCSAALNDGCKGVSRGGNAVELLVLLFYSVTILLYFYGCILLRLDANV